MNLLYRVRSKSPRILEQANKRSPIMGLFSFLPFTLLNIFTRFVYNFESNG